MEEEQPLTERDHAANWLRTWATPEIIIELLKVDRGDNREMLSHVLAFLMSQRIN